MSEGEPDGEDGEGPEADESCLRVDAAVFVGDDAGYEAANRGEAINTC
jgi:hypothetical protein